MYPAYKKTTIRWFLLINLALFFPVLVLTGCTIFSEKKDIQPMTEREYAFEKGVALFDAKSYEKSIPFFLKISRSPPNKQDDLYESALWNLSVAFEKSGSPEKALLTLQELEKTQQNKFSKFKIQIAQLKNHFRVSNEFQALEVKKAIDDNHPMVRYSADEIYSDLIATTEFNYDHLAIAELEYISEVQKYFVFVMESDSAPVNSRATDLMIKIGDRFYEMLNSQNLDLGFRKKIAESLLDFLRRFERYKIDDLNLNMKTVSKFSLFADKKQKQITEWLHQ